MKKCSRCGRLGLFFYIDADGLCEKCSDTIKQQQELEQKRQLELERERQLTTAHAFLADLSAAFAVIPESPPLFVRSTKENLSYALGEYSLKELSEMEAACKRIRDLAMQRYEHPRLWEAFLGECVPAEVTGYVRHPQICTDIFNAQLDGPAQVFTALIENANALCEQVQLAECFESFKYKVVGVTFKNGRRSRQTILRQIRFQDPPYQKTPEIRIEECEYEGEPAFAVYANEEQVGFIGNEDIPELQERWDRYRRVKDFSIRGGGEFHYGMEIIVEFYR